MFCCARFDSVYEDSKGDFVAQRPDRCHDEAVDTVNVEKEEEEQSERTSSCLCQHDDDLRGIDSRSNLPNFNQDAPRAPTVFEPKIKAP